MSSLGVGKLPGTETAIRRELNASVPADLDSVLAFYRTELGKRGWKETAERAVVKPDQAQLAFVSPDGPATLKLGRSNDETSVDLAQKIPAAAAKGDVMPKPGQARLMFVNIGDGEAALTINKQTIKIARRRRRAAGQGPDARFAAGQIPIFGEGRGPPAGSNEIEIAADDTWGLMVAPGGDGDAAAGVLRRSAAAARHCRLSWPVIFGPTVAPQAWSEKPICGAENRVRESRFCEGLRIGFRTA